MNIGFRKIDSGVNSTKSKCFVIPTIYNESVGPVATTEHQGTHLKYGDFFALDICSVVLPQMALRLSQRYVQEIPKKVIIRHLSSREATASTPAVSPFAPRHLLSTADLSPKEIRTLVDRAIEIKQITKHGNTGNAGHGVLTNRSVAMMFSKRSTRTRVSTEAAVAHLGGNSMFLGKDDIQLGVNESLYDTSRVISSMVACMVARVGPHSDVMDLAKASQVPVVNALSDLFHPLQALANLMTLQETYSVFQKPQAEQIKVAWVGDSNNVLHDILITCAKSGIHVSIATPRSVIPDPEILEIAREAGDPFNVKIETTNDPSKAVTGADAIITDTWISMGQESETLTKLKIFEGFQVTNKLGITANDKWRFMHCLPRHQEEVDDDVFYGPRGLVFEEAENRKWVMIAVLEWVLSTQ